MMIPFLDIAFRSVKKQYYDNFADRLNYYYTVLIFLFLALLVSAKQFVGQPIQCWVPAEFRGGWEQYAESYCFVQNTYFLPQDQAFPDAAGRNSRKIGYYQWVPIVLAIQAVMFYMPNLIWKSFNAETGLNLKNILNTAIQSIGFDPKKRLENVQILASHIQESMKLERSACPDSVGGFVCSTLCFIRRRPGSYLCCLYLFVKALYVVNVCGQFFMLNHFLGTNYTFWGAEILSDLAHGREWSESGHFPRVTMCDFSIRKMANADTHTIQCVLLINMFNEKIYLFIWFWMVFVAVCTVVDLIWWMFKFWPSSNVGLVAKYLRAARVGDAEVKRTTERFIRSKLRADGVLLLRFISNHAGDLVATDLTGVLFKEFLNDETLSKTMGSQSKPLLDHSRRNGQKFLIDTKERIDDIDPRGYAEKFKNDDRCTAVVLNVQGETAIRPSAPTKENGTLNHSGFDATNYTNGTTMMME